MKLLNPNINKGIIQDLHTAAELHKDKRPLII